jgi:hypothetical protein
VTISSYDIESLVFRTNETQMQKPRGEEIPLAHSCWLWLKSGEGNQPLRGELSVPDGKRKIFSEGKATLEQLKALRQELEGLLYDIDQGLKRSMRKLAEAKVKWPSGLDWLTHDLRKLHWDGGATNMPALWD